MSFENRFGSDPQATAAYVTRMLEVVGDRDPLDVLCASGAELARVTSRFDERSLHQPESEGKWSAYQVLQHLADSEFAFGFRFRMAIAHDRPALGGFDQDAWMSRLRYGAIEPAVFLAAFDAMRAFNILLYRTLTPDDFRREAVHAERGVESVQHMLRLNAAHDIVHLRQLERIHESISKGRR